VYSCTRGWLQWRCYTRARQVKWPGWKIHRPGSALPSPAYCFASVILWTEDKMLPYLTALFVLFWRWNGINFFEKKVHPGDLAGGFSDLEMTWLFYCAGAATSWLGLLVSVREADSLVTVLCDVFNWSSQLIRRLKDEKI